MGVTDKQWTTALSALSDDLPAFTENAKENDLNPSPSELAFDLRLLEIRVEKIIKLLTGAK